MALSGNVNAHGIDGGLLDNGQGGLVASTTDASGIQLSLGDTVIITNPTPGQNGLPSTPKLVGCIVAMSGSLGTVNVPSTTLLSTAIAVYNIQLDHCLQLYSAMPANMEHSSLP